MMTHSNSTKLSRWVHCATPSTSLKNILTRNETRSRCNFLTEARDEAIGHWWRATTQTGLKRPPGPMFQSAPLQFESGTVCPSQTEPA